MLLKLLSPIVTLATSVMAGSTGDRGESNPHDALHPNSIYSPHHDEANHKIDRRDVGVYWCKGDNWGGGCRKDASDWTCHKWNTYTQGSFGPDRGSKCTMFDQDDCKGNAANVVYPGTGSVGYMIYGPNGLVNWPASWHCHT